MNRLPTLLTAAACGALSLGNGTALAFTPLPVAPGTDLMVRVQLGNGGPVGGGPNGRANGARTYGSAPSVLNPSGANGGAQPGGTATTSGPVNGTGTAAQAGTRPNGAQGGNGSKPAPMQANGVRKIN